VVDEVFGTAEVDEGIMNPLRLNSMNRTRWLCERTMRSDKRMDEIETKVDEMGGQQQTIVEQQQVLMQKIDAQDDLKAKVEEMMAQQKATVEKLDALLSR
jgi:septal ring factor EnvC (AmiA/AmiB activator)